MPREDAKHWLVYLSHWQGCKEMAGFGHCGQKVSILLDFIASPG
jgi:hypothetical protein